MKSNDYLKLGFSCITSLHSEKGNVIIKFIVYYHDIEIYYERVNRRTECDLLFIKVVKSFLRNEKINNLGI